jgi:hypothetical protein
MTFPPSGEIASRGFQSASQDVSTRLTDTLLHATVRHDGIHRCPDASPGGLLDLAQHVLVPVIKARVCAQAGENGVVRGRRGRDDPTAREGRELDQVDPDGRGASPD